MRTVNWSPLFLAIPSRYTNEGSGSSNRPSMWAHGELSFLRWHAFQNLVISRPPALIITECRELFYEQGKNLALVRRHYGDFPHRLSLPLFVLKIIHLCYECQSYWASVTGLPSKYLQTSNCYIYGYIFFPDRNILAETLQSKRLMQTFTS